MIKAYSIAIQNPCFYLYDIPSGKYLFVSFPGGGASFGEGTCTEGDFLGSYYQEICPEEIAERHDFGAIMVALKEWMASHE